jgi:hypothetical protein
MTSPAVSHSLAVVVGDARPLRYQSAGSLRQALRWTREDLQTGAARVAIKGEDLTPLLRLLAELAARFPDSETVELDRHEVAFAREHIGLVAELEALAPRPTGAHGARRSH